MGLATGPSAFTHHIDGSFNDAFTAPTVAPVPTRAEQNPERDVHFDPYDHGDGWRIELKEDGGVVIQANRFPIPTVSEWGLIVMVVLVLTAGTILFGRQRRAAAA